MERMQTKALVEGAIFAGITTVLGVIYYYTQYLGIIAMVWPVPVIIVGYRNGLKASILSAMSAGLIVSLLTHPLVGVGLLVGFGLPGILMGYMIQKRMNPYIIIVICGIVLAVTMVGEFLISLKVSGIDLAGFIAQFDAAMNGQMDVAMDIYNKLGIPESEMQRIGELFKQTVESIKLIFPSAILLSGLFSAFIDYKLTKLILKRIGYQIPDLEKFTLWRLKPPYSYALFGLIVATVAGAYMNIPAFTVIAMNLSTVMMLIFTVLGFSVVLYYAGSYSERHGIPKALKIAIVCFLLLVFMQLIAYVGIFDMAFNFRKLGTEKRIGGVQ